MKKLLLTLLTFLIAVNVAYPQLAIRHRLATPRPADSLDIDYYSPQKGDFRRAPWSSASIWESGLSIYIRKADFAYINGRTIRTTPQTWLRGGTMTPWAPICSCTPTMAACTSTQPGPTDTISGSPTLCLRRQLSHVGDVYGERISSTNDIIATPIGGMALGEVTYRVSDLISTTGNRLVTLPDWSLPDSWCLPMRGLTRIINGDAWKRRSTSVSNSVYPMGSGCISGYTYPGTERRDSGQRCGSGPPKSTSNTATASMRKIPNPTTISPSRRT